MSSVKQIKKKGKSYRIILKRIFLVFTNHAVDSVFNNKKAALDKIFIFKLILSNLTNTWVLSTKKRILQNM